MSPGAWRGAEVVTLSDDLSYAPLADALNDLQVEAKQRSLALRRGEQLPPLTVVLDELPELHAEIPGAGKFAVRLSRWGRELGIRQIVIATSDAALNIPGWAATRSNYARVELGKPTPDGTRPATLDGTPLDLGNVKEGAARAQLRPWRAVEGATMPIPAAPKPASYDLLGALLDAPAPSASKAVGSLDAPATAPTSAPNGLGADVGAPAISLELDAPTGHLTVNVSASASGTPRGPRRAPRGKGLDMRRRRQLAQAAQIDTKKDELRRAYEARKAAGGSHRKAFAELGGNSEESRAWWKAAPDPKATRP